MIRKFLAMLLIAGAYNAYPHEDKSTTVPIPNPVDPENDSIDPGEVPPFIVPPKGNPVGHDRNPVQPEKAHFPEDVLVSTKVPEGIPGPQAGSKPDGSDLKTDASFWPHYKTWWSYPTYRTYSYWSYPTYRTYYYTYPRSHSHSHYRHYDWW